MRARRRERWRRWTLVVALVATAALLGVAAQDVGTTEAPANGSAANADPGAGPEAGSAAGSTLATTTTLPPATDPTATTAPPMATDAPKATTTAPATTDAAPATTAPVATTPTPTESTAAPTETPVATAAAPTETPVPTTAAPTETPAATTATPTETPTPTTTAPVATTAAPVATTAAPVETPTPTETTEAPATTTPTPTTAEPTPTPTPAPATDAPTETPEATTSAPTTAAPSSSSSSNKDTTAASDSTGTSDESGAGTVAPAQQATLSPITEDSDADDDTSESSVGTGNASSNSSSLGSGAIAGIIAGVLVAVVASLFFVRFQNNRGKVFKRARGSSQQRALDSFFRQNRVTLMASAYNSASRLAFNATGTGGHFTTPLTPTEEIPVTSLGPSDGSSRPVVVPTAAAATPATVFASSHFRPRGRTADVIAGPSADVFSRDTTRSAMSSMRSYSSGDYDSFRGDSFRTSSRTSTSFYTQSADSDSIIDSSGLPSTGRSTRHFMARHMSSDSDFRGTVRSGRSSSDFSVFNSSVDSIDDSQQFVSIALPTGATALDSNRSGMRTNSDASDSLLSEDSYDSDLDSYGAAPDSIHRVSELSEGEI